MNIYILVMISLAISSCMSISGTYVVQAYDKDGTEINRNLNFTAEGSGVYSARNAICLQYPGSVVKIKDIKTGQELQGESPYQCSGTPIVFSQAFKAPNNILFTKTLYKLAHKSLKQGGAIYEFTTGDETTEGWTSLITLLYNKHSSVSPTEWVSYSNSQAVKPLATSILGNHAYAQIIFNPTNQYPYFETAIKKTFHLEQCGGLVTYSYAKKYPPTENLDTIINDNKQVFHSLELDAWSPACHMNQ